MLFCKGNQFYLYKPDFMGVFVTDVISGLFEINEIVFEKKHKLHYLTC